jgi:hypothetical protein
MSRFMLIGLTRKNLVMANAVKQSMPLEFMDCRGLRPRSDEISLQPSCTMRKQLLIM